MPAGRRLLASGVGERTEVGGRLGCRCRANRGGGYEQYGTDERLLEFHVALLSYPRVVNNLHAKFYTSASRGMGPPSCCPGGTPLTRTRSRPTTTVDAKLHPHRKLFHLDADRTGA